MTRSKKILFALALQILLVCTLVFISPTFAQAADQSLVIQKCDSMKTKTADAGPLAYTISKVWNLLPSWWGANGGVTTSLTDNGNGTYTCTASGGGIDTTLYIDGNGNFTTGPGGIGGTISEGGVTTTISGDGKATELKKEITGASCASLPSFIGSFATCLGRSVSVLLGTALITLTAWLLGLAGLLFNVLVDHTILNFGGLFYSGGVKDAIDAAWSAFRDIANIIIIGMFVFIAISIILGLNEFGQKKMVVRVLVIAVLINFSLLFTKLIIDGSNFTASQFYTVTKLDSASPDAPTGVGVTQFAQAGISGKFIDFMGVSSIKDTKDALSNAAFGNANNSSATPNGWIALLHGLFAATLLLVAAIVLLYGCLLLAARALLLLFLMFTAAIAFASYLIPRWETSSSYGWKAWWSSLLKSAVFAPILMLFLWISLKVGEAVKVKSKGGTLGALLSDPGASPNLEALFGYVVVVGILFISLRLSSVFAGRIAGFSLASMAAFAPIGLGSRLAAFGLRQTIGRGFTKSEELAGVELKRSRDRLATLPRDTWSQRRAYDREAQKVASLAREAARYGRYADSRMNIMDTGVAKTLTSAIGIKGILAGQSAKGTKGFGAAAKAQAEAAAKIAERIAPAADVETARRAAEKKRREDLQTSKAQIKATLDGARTAAATAAQSVKDAQRERDDKLIDAARGKPGYAGDHAELDDAKTKSSAIGDQWKDEIRQQLVAVTDTATRARLDTKLTGAGSADDMKALRDQIAQAVSDPIQQQRVTQQLMQSQQAHESELRKEEKRIEDARNAILPRALRDATIDKNSPAYQAAQTKLAQANVDLNALTQQVATLNSRHNALSDDEIKRQAEAAGNDFARSMIEGAAAAARQVGRQQAWLGNKGRVGGAAEKIYRSKNTRNARITRDLQQYLKEEGDAPAPPTPPPTTP